jgi:cytochrome c oxidase cbb3-type subunit 3
MRARWLPAWLCLAACESAPDNQDGGETPEQRGAAHYQQYCEVCHGDAGQGYEADNATAIGNPEFLRIADDELLSTAIRYGRPGTVMSAWGRSKAGPLTDADIDDLVAFIRTWQAEPRVGGGA